MIGNRATLAILMITAAAALAPVGDMFAKILGGLYAASLIAFGRYLAGGAAGLTVLVLSGRFRWIGFSGLPSQVARASMMASSIYCLIAALNLAPLADVMAGFYIAPVAAAGVSATFLGEKMSSSRSLGLAMALFGGIAILDPTGSFNVGGALAVCSGLLFAFYLVAAKLAPRDEDGASAAVIQSLIAAALMAPVALPGLEAAPPLWAIGLFLLIGVISVVCQGATLAAHRWADATTLAPFFYAALASSVLIGFAVFDEAPSPAGALGILAILFGGLLVAFEHRGDDPAPLESSSA
ncbi:MAG: DMT family transporter [Pseudomonadota bacterium]